MKSLFTIYALIVPLALGWCQVHAPSSTGQVSKPDKSEAPGLVTVSLAKPLNSRKLKTGDPVEAKTLKDLQAGGGLAFPPGSKVIGHVVAATARSKGDAQSTLKIVFDKVVRQDREAAQLDVTILAVAPDPAQLDSDPGGHVDYGDRTAVVYNSRVPPAHGSAVPLLNDESRGVLGITNMQLQPGGLLLCDGKEVMLSSGTRLLLAVQPGT